MRPAESISSRSVIPNNRDFNNATSGSGASFASSPFDCANRVNVDSVYSLS